MFLVLVTYAQYAETHIESGSWVEIHFAPFCDVDTQLP